MVRLRYSTVRPRNNSVTLLYGHGTAALPYGTVTRSPQAGCEECGADQNAAKNAKGADKRGVTKANGEDETEKQRMDEGDAKASTKKQKKNTRLTYEVR